VGKVLGFICVLIFAAVVGGWLHSAYQEADIKAATATAAVSTAVAVSTLHPEITITVCPNQRGSTCIGTPSCTNGAYVQINDDGAITMPRGAPPVEYDCDFVPSQSKVLYWKGQNAELSITGMQTLIKMQSADQWIQINAGTSYHIHGRGGDGTFYLSLSQN